MNIVICVIWCRDGSNAGARARSASQPRPWYKRALGGLLPRRKPASLDAPPPAAHGKRTSYWRSSLKAAASAVARAACICEPLCSTNVHVDAVAPRRRRVAARTPVGRSPPEMLPAGEWGEAPWAFFRGRTVNEDLLMRRFVVEEEATRWRSVKEVAAKRFDRMWIPPPASRLSTMSLAGYDDNAIAEEEAGGESGSPSFRFSEDHRL